MKLHDTPARRRRTRTINPKGYVPLPELDNGERLCADGLLE